MGGRTNAHERGSEVCEPATTTVKMERRNSGVLTVIGVIGGYSVVVTHSFNSIASDDAVLTVLPP